jgi:hypothetical protein
VLSAVAIGHGQFDVVPSKVPGAYFLPGAGGRIVLTSALSEELSPGALSAVVEHECAHQRGRHPMVRLPFVAGASWRGVPLWRFGATTTALLMECAADDHVRRRGLSTELAEALHRHPAGPALGSCALSLGASGDIRLLRLDLRPTLASRAQAMLSLTAYLVLWTVLIAALTFA